MRSWSDSDSVLAMPVRAITTATTSRAYTTLITPRTCDTSAATSPSRSRTVGPPSGGGGLDRGKPVIQVHAGGEFDDGQLEPGLARGQLHVARSTTAAPTTDSFS